MTDVTNYADFEKPDLFREYLLLKANPLQFLFQQQGSLIIHARIGKEKYRFQVELRNRYDDLPWDCKIVCLSLNVFFRTPEGISGKKYKTFELMLKSAEKLIKKKFQNAKIMGYQFLLDEGRSDINLDVIKPQPSSNK